MSYARALSSELLKRNGSCLNYLYTKNKRRWFLTDTLSEHITVPQADEVVITLPCRRAVEDIDPLAAERERESRRAEWRRDEERVCFSVSYRLSVSCVR